MVYKLIKTNGKGQDLRKEPRIDNLEKIEVFYALLEDGSEKQISAFEIASIVDISRNGLGLVIGSKMTIGDLLSLKIKYLNKNYSFGAKVCYQHSQGFGYRTGLKLRKPEEEYQNMVGKMLNEAISYSQKDSLLNKIELEIDSKKMSALAQDAKCAGVSIENFILNIVDKYYNTKSTKV